MGNYHVKLKYIVNIAKYCANMKTYISQVNYLYSTLIMGEMASKENKIFHTKLLNIVDENYDI